MTELKKALENVRKLAYELKEKQMSIENLEKEFEDIHTILKGRVHPGFYFTAGILGVFSIMQSIHIDSFMWTSVSLGLTGICFYEYIDAHDDKKNAKKDVENFNRWKKFSTKKLEAKEKTLEIVLAKEKQEVSKLEEKLNLAKDNLENHVETFLNHHLEGETDKDKEMEGYLEEKEKLELCQIVLEKYTIPEQYYNVGAYQENAFCMMKKVNEWEVFYGHNQLHYESFVCDDLDSGIFHFFEKIAPSEETLETMIKDYVTLKNSNEEKSRKLMKRLGSIPQNH